MSILHRLDIAITSRIPKTFLVYLVEDCIEPPCRSWRWKMAARATVARILYNIQGQLSDDNIMMLGEKDILTAGWVRQGQVIMTEVKVLGYSVALIESGVEGRL